MCGIYGFCGKPTKKTAKIIRQLGILNEERGTDSTGLAFIVKENHKGQIYKSAVRASKFFQQSDPNRIMASYRKADFLTILGHTRMATHGAVNSDNAHPFRIGDTVFTHNGVIWNFRGLQERLQTKYEVDSQIIGHLLEITEDYEEAFKQLNGYFTVPFVNLNEKNLLQVAVHEQQFAYAIRGSQLYYSSDIKHLKKALDGKGFQICQGGNDTLYSFYMVGNSIVVSKQGIQAGDWGSRYSSYDHRSYNYSYYTGYHDYSNLHGYKDDDYYQADSEDRVKAGVMKALTSGNAEHLPFD